MFLRRPWQVFSAIVSLSVLVGLLIALGAIFSAQHPSLVVAQQQRKLAAQQDEANRRKAVAVTRPCSPLLPSGECDQTESKRRDEEIEIQRKLLYWTRIIAIIGFVVGLAQATIIYVQTQHTGKAATAAATNAKAALLAERAYVGLSHDRPGLKIGPDDISFSIGMKNHGRTPASISDATMIWVFGKPKQPLPVDPPYGRPPRSKLNAVLMPGDVHHHKEFRPLFAPETMHSIAEGELNVWLMGYIDYKTIFERWHRSGYCRKYTPKPVPGDNNNLVFESQGGYNYDVEIDEQGNPKKA